MMGRADVVTRETCPRRAQQAIDAINAAMPSGRREVVVVDLSGYFDMIPHGGLMWLIQGGVSDGSNWKLIKGWLRSPFVEEDPETGVKRTVKNHCGTPQEEVIGEQTTRNTTRKEPGRVMAPVKAWRGDGCGRTTPKPKRSMKTPTAKNDSTITTAWSTSPCTPKWQTT
jgi:hypothetical protein